MQYIKRYTSPIGDITMSSDGEFLTGLWFDGQKHFALNIDKECIEADLPVFDTAEGWLDIYFSGNEPDFEVPIKFSGTEFQNEVWEILCTVPYGKTVTYGEIAKDLAKRRGINKMSAQAVGGAVGRNPISIIVPCHRVIGSKGNLTGYAGGLDKKIALLKSEKSYTAECYLPSE